MNNIVESDRPSLDNLDKAILRIVQENNQLTHTDIGERVGLSTSAVRRRLATLRQTKCIVRDVSLLNTDKFGVTLIVSVSFSEDSAEAYDDFDQQMRDLPNVKQSYHVSGSTDYILIVQGPSLTWYEDWSKQTLMSNKALKRHDTAVVWSCKKFETAMPI